MTVYQKIKFYLSIEQIRQIYRCIQIDLSIFTKLHLSLPQMPTSDSYLLATAELFVLIYKKNQLYLIIHQEMLPNDTNSSCLNTRAHCQKWDTLLHLHLKSGSLVLYLAIRVNKTLRLSNFTGAGKSSFQVNQIRFSFNFLSNFRPFLLVHL